MSEKLSETQRAVERDFAILQKAGIIRHERKVNAGLWVVLEYFKQFVLDYDRQFIFQAHTECGRQG